MTAIEERIVGTWRSYKLFHFLGKVEQHNASFYIELSIDEERVLTLFHTQAKNQTTILKPDEWNIAELKKRQYLNFGKRQAYEIMTLETENLVLNDVVKGEKIFFAKLPGWHQRIEPVIESIRHIKPDKTKGTH